MGDARRRRERLTEYNEARAAHEETNSPEHRMWMHRALRSKDTNADDVQRVNLDNIDRQVDYNRETESIKREIGWQGLTRKEKDKDNG